MIDQIAVPFWLCLSVGLVVGLATGNEGLWTAVGAAVGLVLGFAVGARAVAKRRAAFQGGKAQAATPTATTTAPPQDLGRAA